MRSMKLRPAAILTSTQRALNSMMHRVPGIPLTVSFGAMANTGDLDGIVAITMKNEAVGSDAEAEQGRVVSFELLDVAGLGLEKTGEGL